MEEGVLSLLREWEVFYLIVGPSAAVLIGLQFVVITTGAEANTQPSTRTISAFGSPTIVHFCMVLALSALMGAPWPTLSGLDIALGITGLVAVAYTAMVVRRERRQTGYTPVLEDWIFHAILPLVAYVALLAAALLMIGSTLLSLFIVGAATLLLLFIGIHNSWDAVVYLAVSRRREQSGEDG